MMARNLIILRCGRNSLHWQWLEAGDRNWDIILCPYQEIDARGLESHLIEGQKWSGLHRFLTEFQAWRDYDYICLPDDDLAADGATWNTFFDRCEAYEISLAAPALTKDSYFSHAIALQNTEFLARSTTFVEIMTPCFSRRFLETALPTFALSRSGTGFGLDFLWGFMLSYRDIWIIDETPLHHTRPVGTSRDKVLAELAAYDLGLIKGFGVPLFVYSIGGVYRTGRFTQVKAGFESRLRLGYAYLEQRISDFWYSELLKSFEPPSEIDRSVIDRLSFALAYATAPDRTISRGRPCITSSVSEWSWSQDPALEATGANDGLLNGLCGFHTDLESNPWWQVDLGAACFITSIVIYNRLDMKSRCVDFDILTSFDSETWVISLSKRDGLLFGGVDGSPFRAAFSPALRGRFVRIQLFGHNFLHLDQVEIFGAAIAIGEEPTFKTLTPVVENYFNNISLPGADNIVLKNRGAIKELLAELYGDDGPLSYADDRYRDSGYPHTNLIPDVVESIVDTIQPGFWLELGSMLGGSAIRVADVVKTRAWKTDIVCIDPFTGDVNMWAWEQPKREANEWQFLRLEHGRPTIYERFLANVSAAGHADIILPIMATSIVGLKLLRRLVMENRLSSAPSVIYLDSAHEPDETFLELQSCWNLLGAGGVLMGDDWSWEAVRKDVLRFVKTIELNQNMRQLLVERHQKFTEQDGVLLDRGQWVLVK